MSKGKWGGVLALVCLVMALALMPPAMGVSNPSGRAAAVGQPQKVTKAEVRRTKQFWTKARMRKAEEMPLGVAPGGPAPSAPDIGAPVTLPAATSPVSAPTAVGRRVPGYTEGYYQGATTSAPARAIGKLFFQQWNAPKQIWEEYVCSAAIVSAENLSVLWTAGHCVFETIDNNYNRNFRFCPAYNATYGCVLGVWYPKYKLTTNHWINTNGCYRDAGLIRCYEYAFDADLGSLVMRPKTDYIQNVTGGHQLSVNYTTVDAYRILYGYPGNKNDGQSLYYCAGQNWHTTRYHLAMYCSAGGGASGGPWLWSFNSYNYGKVVSVNSHGSGIMEGPYQGDIALSLYNAMRNQNPN